MQIDPEWLRDPLITDPIHALFPAATWHREFITHLGPTIKILLRVKGRDNEWIRLHTEQLDSNLWVLQSITSDPPFRLISTEASPLGLLKELKLRRFIQGKV